MEQKVLIIMPTLNEAENLPLIVPAVFAAVPFVPLLIIDDGSPDGTGEIADRMAAKDERISVMHRTGKLGLGSAYITVFHWAL